MTGMKSLGDESPPRSEVVWQQDLWPVGKEEDWFELSIVVQRWREDDTITIELWSGVGSLEDTDLRDGLTTRQARDVAEALTKAAEVVEGADSKRTLHLVKWNDTATCPRCYEDVRAWSTSDGIWMIPAHGGCPQWEVRV